MANRKMINKLTSTLYAVLSLVIIFGSYLRLQHIEYASSIVSTSIFLGVALLIIENSYLKKTIKTLEKQPEKTV